MIFLDTILTGNNVLDLLGKVLIPLIIGWITFQIARKQIRNAGVTHFRQQWIDNLRDSLSVFVAKAEMIGITDYDDDDNYFEHFKELVQMQHKIELLLNPDEDDHNQIVKHMEKIREIVHEEDLDEDELEKRLDPEIIELMKVSKRVLKREWIVVKTGK